MTHAYRYRHINGVCWAYSSVFDTVDMAQSTVSAFKAKALEKLGLSEHDRWLTPRPRWEYWDGEDFVCFDKMPDIPLENVGIISGQQILLEDEVRVSQHTTMVYVEVRLWGKRLGSIATVDEVHRSPFPKVNIPRQETLQGNIRCKLACRRTRVM